MKLNIGPGRDRLSGFQNLDIEARAGVDIVCDARKIPLEDNTVELIYASHVIEHIPWYETVKTLKEWLRVLQPGGALEIWTVNAYKVAKFLLAAEEAGATGCPDNWTRRNPDHDPIVWCAGRMFAYAKLGRPDDPNWHRALFTPKHLHKCYEEAGFVNVRFLAPTEVRGKDHGWVNLGVTGSKA